MKFTKNEIHDAILQKWEDEFGDKKLDGVEKYFISGFLISALEGTKAGNKRTSEILTTAVEAALDYVANNGIPIGADGADLYAEKIEFDHEEVYEAIKDALLPLGIMLERKVEAEK